MCQKRSNFWRAGEGVSGLAFALAIAMVASAHAAPATYSPGLGDNLNTFHWAIGFRNSIDGSLVYYTFDQAMEAQRQLYNVTNGTHTVSFGYGWEAGSAYACPYFNQDTVAPFDSGFQKYRNLTRNGYKYNADTGLCLDSQIAGPNAISGGLVSDADKALDANGNWKSSWASSSGYPFYNLSMANMTANGHLWANINANIANFGMNFSVYNDALNPDAFSMNNESTARGAPLTTTAQEWTAVTKFMDDLWTKHGIGNFTEDVDPKYQGHVWGFYGYSAAP